jgi:hypothetical protein
VLTKIEPWTGPGVGVGCGVSVLVGVGVGAVFEAVTPFVGRMTRSCVFEPVPTVCSWNERDPTTRVANVPADDGGLPKLFPWIVSVCPQTRWSKR